MSKLNVPTVNRIKDYTKGYAYALVDRSVEQAYEDISEHSAKIVLSQHKDAGKLGNIPNFASINTNPLLIDYCNKHCKIKNLCYGFRLLFTARRNANPNYAYNSILLRQTDFDECIPNIPNKIKMLRINSMGEIENKTVMKNLITIAERYPDKLFRIYTKRYDIVDSLIYKPNNVSFIMSGLDVNDFNTYLPRKSSKKFMLVGDDSPVPTADELNLPSVHLCVEKCSECMNCYLDDGIPYIISRVK